jgi:hypothetical protein
MPSKRAGRHFRQCRALANDLKMRELFDDVAISRQQILTSLQEPKRPGQGRRNGCETAHPDEVVHFRGDEQYPQKTPSHRELTELCKNGSSSSLN